MKIDVGEMIGRTFKAQDIQHIFALHGGHVDPVFQGCRRHGIRIIDTRHEAAAGHMADGWSRVTGKPAVAVVTAGPGVTNVVTAVANAFMDSVPMVLIGGRHALGDEETLPLQELHGLPIMASITKWSRLVRDPARVPEYITMAMRQATTGRPGPVFLEIPSDVINSSVEEAGIRFPKKARPDVAPAPSEEAVEEVLKILSQAERPVIFAGRGVWFAEACDQLRQFAELTGIPVCANGLARGAVSEDGPLGIGGFMTAGRVLDMAGGADVVLLLGGRLGMFTGGRRSIIPARARIIQVDIHGEEIGRMRDIELGIVADCKQMLRALIHCGASRTWPSRRAWVEKLGQIKTLSKAAFSSALDPNRSLIHPYRLVHDVSALIKDRGTLVVDGGETSVWAEVAVSISRPGRYLSHGYLGCLGTGIPFGLAAKLARPEEPVLVLTGDGSMGFNFAEFDTAHRHKIPIVVVINHDHAWGMCKHEQMVRYGKGGVVGTELLPTHYEKAVEAFGGHAEFVDAASDIIPAVERAISSHKPACVNVMTDPEVFSPMFQPARPIPAKSPVEAKV